MHNSQSQHSEAPIFELHIRPTYAVRIPQRTNRGQSLSKKSIENQKNLANNKLTGVLSAKASRRLSNSVNWLIASAKQKYIFDKKTGKKFSFKINFITLTLPTVDHNISDHAFKTKLLHNFINTCRASHGLKNYVWKVETQENGNIHAHFTTDTFIHYEELRSIWNRILIKHGVMKSYTEKHSQMSFDDYVLEYASRKNSDISKLRKAYDFGVATKWLSPNSTDVHAVHRVKDIASYIATYMSKKEEGRRIIKGRIWSCSTNLSEKNKLVIELLGGESYEYMSSFMKDEIKYKVIESVNKTTGLIKNVGEIYFYKISDWGKVLTGKVLEVFNEHRFKIRHNLPIDNLKYITHVDHEQPKILNINITQRVKQNQLKLNL